MIDLPATGLDRSIASAHNSYDTGYSIGTTGNGDCGKRGARERVKRGGLAAISILVR
jgi:hypothetical protein